MKGRDWSGQVWSGTDQGRSGLSLLDGLKVMNLTQRKAQQPVLPSSHFHGAERSKEKEGPCKSQVQARRGRKSLGHRLQHERSVLYLSVSKVTFDPVHLGAVSEWGNMTKQWCKSPADSHRNRVEPCLLLQAHIMATH